MELYRKYRPKSFDSVIGQNHITKTLIGQVEKNRIGHAYLFTGTRGTGKTTCAKIFARAINCLNPKNGSPCGECEVCRAYEKGGNLDIVEMDAASNNGVDDIRDLIDQTKYPPVVGKYKVYIIDEVHMLTPGAFNAFLKTLEEPPAYMVFILATTEVHKLPQTIISRCMRFDFRLVTKEKIAERVKEVYDGENIEYEEDVLSLIAEAGEGSVRDALTIADRCIKVDEKITYDDVADILGTSRREDIYALFDAITTSNVGKTLEAVESLGAQGKIMSVVAKDFIAFTKEVLIAKTTGRAPSGSEEVRRNIAERAKIATVDNLVAIIKIFSSVDADLRYSLSPVITLEMTAVRAARLYDVDYSALEARVSRLEKNGVALPQLASATDTEKKTLNKPMDAYGVWGRLTTYFRTNESMTFYTVVGAQNNIRIEDGNLIVTADAQSYETLTSQACKDALARGLAYDGAALRVVIELKNKGVDMDREAEKMKKLSGDAKFRIVKK